MLREHDARWRDGKRWTLKVPIEKHLAASLAPLGNQLLLLELHVPLVDVVDLHDHVRLAAPEKQMQDLLRLTSVHRHSHTPVLQLLTSVLRQYVARRGEFKADLAEAINNCSWQSLADS